MLVGAVIGLLVTQALAGSIYGVTPSDPFSYASTGALLMIVSPIASCWPAYRAMRVNPARALRTE